MSNYDLPTARPRDARHFVLVAMAVLSACSGGESPTQPQGLQALGALPNGPLRWSELPYPSRPMEA